MDTKVTQRNTGIINQANLGEAARSKQSRIAKKPSTELGAGAAQAPASDFGVNLSSTSKELAVAHKKAMDIALQTPEVREDRVAELKKRIAEGSYKVDSGKIADGMIRETLFDYLHETGQDWEV